MHQCKIIVKKPNSSRKNKIQAIKSMLKPRNKKKQRLKTTKANTAKGQKTKAGKDTLPNPQLRPISLKPTQHLLQHTAKPGRLPLLLLHNKQYISNMLNSTKLFITF